LRNTPKEVKIANAEKSFRLSNIFMQEEMKVGQVLEESVPDLDQTSD